MKKSISILTYLFTALLLVIGLGLFSLTNQGIVSWRAPYARQLPERLYTDQSVVAFENVHVVPMDTERVLENQTVIVENGMITEIGNQGMIEIPADAQRIQGRGRYLMPGLVDMHVHVKEENELLLFAANGVTTIRNMWGGAGALRMMGFPDHLAWKIMIEEGELFGPTLYTSGPIMEGPPKTMPLMEVYASPQAAAEAVNWQAAQGYDFIKVYDFLDVPTYQAVIQTADMLNLAVVGHVPKLVGLASAIESGQATMEHLSGFIDSDAAAYIIPEDDIAGYAQMTKEAGIWICPTIAVYQMHVPNEDLHVLDARSEMAYVSPGMKLTWQYFSRPGAMSRITYQGDYSAWIRENFLATTGILHENGVKFILGTDADNPYLVPGFSLLDELDYLVEAGLSPYEAIEAGTSNSAKALGKLDEFGTVEVGKRADLILVEGNPLASVENVRQRAGVMLRGQWIDEAQLENMMQELVDSYRPTLVDRIWPLGLIAIAGYLVIRKMQRQQRPG